MNNKNIDSQSESIWHPKNLKHLKWYVTNLQLVLKSASEIFVCHKKIRIRFNFLLFTSIASILIGKDDEYEKKNAYENFGLRVQGPYYIYSYSYLLIHV